MEEIKDLVKAEYENGNIVVAGIEGLMTMKMDDFIRQHVDGMLYDLNRGEAVVLTFLPDPKWVNDYAVCKVIRALKSNIDKLENIIEIKENERKEWADMCIKKQAIIKELEEIYDSLTYGDNEIEDLEKKGEYYGYPKCCIDNFCTNFMDFEQVDNDIHKGTGFIPCPTCIEKIKNGSATLSSLIKNRKHPLPFPRDDFYDDLNYKN